MKDIIYCSVPIIPEPQTKQRQKEHLINLDAVKTQNKQNTKTTYHVFTSKWLSGTKYGQ